MASAPADIFDEFLAARGHEPEPAWDRSYNKKQCPECGGLHGLEATTCSVCGWVGPQSE